MGLFMADRRVHVITTQQAAEKKARARAARIAAMARVHEAAVRAWVREGRPASQ